MEKERKIQIIRAADKRFARHGLAKTTLEEIARDLRIGKATIYHYFTSKEALFYETIEWEASQIIEEIKQIFNNEDKDIKERFTDYLQFKDSLPVKYQLVYEVALLLLKEGTFEKELQIVQNLLKSEEEVLKLVLGSLYASKIETMKPDLPAFFVMHSWGSLFANKLTGIYGGEKNISSNLIFHKILDDIFS